MFPIRKPVTKIGRGGQGTWADAQIVADPRVSREHCWLVMQPSGRYFIQDVSLYGTSLNGAALPPPERSADNSVVSAGSMKELKSGDSIDLAGVITINFEVTQP